MEENHDKTKRIALYRYYVSSQIALLFYQGYDSNSIINSNEEGYKYYINLYQGKLTEEKEKSIKAEYDSVTNAQAYLEDLSHKKEMERLVLRSMKKNLKVL